MTNQFCDQRYKLQIGTGLFTFLIIATIIIVEFFVSNVPIRLSVIAVTIGVSGVFVVWGLATRYTIENVKNNGSKLTGYVDSTKIIHGKMGYNILTATCGGIKYTSFNGDKYGPIYKPGDPVTLYYYHNTVITDIPEKSKIKQG